MFLAETALLFGREKSLRVREPPHPRGYPLRARVKHESAESLIPHPRV
jgi:hypothetical protein